MRRILICAAALILLFSCSAEEALDNADLSALEEFAQSKAGLDVNEIIDLLLAGEIKADSLSKIFRENFGKALAAVRKCALSMLAPVLVLTLSSAICRKNAAAFLPRLTLMLSMCEAVRLSLAAAEDCLKHAQGFLDAAAPALSALMAAMGMQQSAALISPAAALGGSFVGDAFMRWGLPLCRLALCAAAADGLGTPFGMRRAVKLFRQICGWGTGLCFTLFTALIVLQGNMSASMDGVAVRTAKYAVDSAAPVIGSGVSEVWESYVAGIISAKSAVGISGVLILLAAVLKPMITAAAAMLLLHGISVLLELLGEERGASAAEQMGGVCRMALELSCGAAAIATVLLGAIISAGGSLIA